jgi:hypothetical protein
MGGLGIGCGDQINDLVTLGRGGPIGDGCGCLGLVNQLDQLRRADV